MRRYKRHYAVFVKRNVWAFTLVEMLVSLAVLGIALAVVGVVFNVTVNTTRQAAAYSEAQNLTQQFINQIQDDLNHCDPASSVLVLVGRTQAAARTQAQREAGEFWRVLVGDPTAMPTGFDPLHTPVSPTLNPATYQYSDPRADILMFFTNRPTPSQAPPPYADATVDEFRDACMSGARFSPIEVVYGHAALDQAVYNSSSKKFVLAGNPQHIEGTASGTSPTSLSRLPVTSWHLSRRATVLNAPRPGAVIPECIQYDNNQFTNEAWNDFLACQPHPHSSSPPPNAGDAARLDLPVLLNELSYNATQPPSGTRDTWFEPYAFDVTTNRWNQTVQNAIRLLLYGSYASSSTGYNNHHIATVVENPPPDLASNIAVQLLQGCAWFQVEFLMPEDPRNSPRYNGNPALTTDSERRDIPRWTEISAGSTYVFIPDTPANRSDFAAAAVTIAGMPTGRLIDFAKVDRTLADSVNAASNRVIRMWPYAIRVTVRVFDRLGRLKEPIVRSIVHRFD